MPYKNLADRKAQGKRAYAKLLTQRGREAVRRRNKESYERCAETLNVERRAIRAAHSPDEVAARREYLKVRTRHWRLKEFGLTETDFDLMLANQLWACAICCTPFAEKDRPHLDHCHASGKVRGLLCGHCNRGLGLFRDSTQALGRAITYLQTR